MTAALEVSMVERVLGRPVWRIPLEEPLAQLKGRRLLVTGASGSVGHALAETMYAQGRGIRAFRTDVGTVDVRVRRRVWEAVDAYRPDVIFHLAGAKHAPHGELDPWDVTETNTVGTRNILDAASSCDAKVVFASTCKACDPETAYGASKLIAERMTLNVGGTVARFYNVVETCGNVFEAWEQLDEDAAVPVTPCRRYFMALQEAVALLLWSAVLPSGRYTVAAWPGRPLTDVAESVYPGREQTLVPPRRGDRREEPLLGSSEYLANTAVEGIMKVCSPHEVAA